MCGLELFENYFGFGGEIRNDHRVLGRTKFVSAFPQIAEELGEPQHPLDVGLRIVESDANAPFVPVEKHPEEPAGDVFDVSHINPERATFLLIEEKSHRFP